MLFIFAPYLILQNQRCIYQPCFPAPFTKSLSSLEVGIKKLHKINASLAGGFLSTVPPEKSCIHSSAYSGHFI